MKYRNTKTGFVFDSDSECTGEDWEKLDPLPAPKEEKAAEQPKKAKKGNAK